MRTRNAQSTLDRRITWHVQRAKSISLASVSAATIARVLLNGSSQLPGRTPIFRLRAARVTGALELPHASLGIPIVFENCTFDEPVTLRDGDVKVLEFRSCTLPVFEGRALRVAGDLTFADTRVGRVDLFGARVGGQLWLNNAHVAGSEADWALNAPQIEVAGGFYASGLTVHGGLNLWGADIRAGLELDGANLTAKNHPALRAPNLNVAGDVTIGGGATISGDVNLSSATVGGRLMLNYQLADGHKLCISNGDIKSLHLEVLPAEHVTVDLDGAVVTSFLDTRQSWP